MVPRWVLSLFVMLVEYFFARRCDQIRMDPLNVLLFDSYELLLHEAAPVCVPDAVHSLIRSLQNYEQKLGAVARLASQLLAAVSVPRSLKQNEEILMGGVLDISNRDPLDRLLLSELAHDDLTLTARIATREALYLRRESPPAYPPRHRVIVVDTGIRLWGISVNIGGKLTIP